MRPRHPIESSSLIAIPLWTRWKAFPLRPEPFDRDFGNLITWSPYWADQGCLLINWERLSSFRCGPKWTNPTTKQNFPPNESCELNSHFETLILEFCEFHHLVPPLRASRTFIDQLRTAFKPLMSTNAPKIDWSRRILSKTSLERRKRIWRHSGWNCGNFITWSRVWGHQRPLLVHWGRLSTR